MDTIQYKCPNCGGPLEYKATTQKFGCEYCLSEFTDEEIKKIFQTNEGMDLTQNIQENTNTADFIGNLYSCGTCGAEIMADDNTAATFCVYCHNPVMLKGRLSGDYRPSKILPFEIGKDKALSIFKETMGKKKFTPSDFMSTNTLEKMTGLYVPFWLADCNVSASLNAIGKHTRSWHSGDYKYTETKEYSVEREATIKYKGVPADGSSKIDDDLMDAMEPFNYNKMKNFSMSYLSGFLADRYDVDKGNVFPRIREKVNSGTKNIMNDSIKGYNSVVSERFDCNILKTDWHYALLPVWFMTYNYNGKMYEFAVNGQTGKIAGNPPLSKKKLWIFGLALCLAGALITGLGGFLF